MSTLPLERPLIVVRHTEPLFARGLAVSLRRLPGFDVGGADAPLAAARVVVCDVESGRRCAEEASRAGIVVVARKPREFEIQESLACGVMGYVVAGCTPQELDGAVLAAAHGRRFLCSAAAREMANGLGATALTVRERDVLRLLAQGRCNKTIASQLRIAVGTVKTHVRAILGKLEAHSRTEAASVAVARGLLPESCADEAASDRATPAVGPWRASAGRAAPAAAAWA